MVILPIVNVPNLSKSLVREAIAEKNTAREIDRQAW